MAIKKVKTGWQVHFRPTGSHGQQIKRTFPTKREAEAFQVSEKAKANAAGNDYLVPVSNKLRLSDLTEQWFKLHGSSLKDGTKRFQKLEALTARLGNPLAAKFTAEHWLEYRGLRLNDELRNGRKISANNVNHEQAYLSAVYGFLIKTRIWKDSNPLKGIPKLKIDEPALTFLESAQITALLSACSESKNPNLLLIVKICLSTGARWGEASTLTGLQVKHGKIHYIKTKNSHSRAVPICLELQDELLTGRPKNGRLFSNDSKSAFETAIKKAGISLPRGQATHVLRHTFASHYMINDGNILKLQKALGHKTLHMTMRYAKLAPEHLAETLEKNPLANLKVA